MIFGMPSNKCGARPPNCPEMDTTPGIQRSQWRVIILSSLGGALEFYDFVIYRMFAAYI